MNTQVRADLIAYQKAHRNRWNQRLHYFAFLFALLAWVSLLFDWRATFGLAVLHYLFSWVGHFVFERNRPASFKKPWLGFYAGFLWFFLRTVEIVVRRRVLPLP